MSESKMTPRLRAEELTGMISLLRDKFVRSENLRRCCFVKLQLLQLQLQLQRVKLQLFRTYTVCVFMMLPFGLTLMYKQ